MALAVETVFRWLTGYRQKPGFQKKQIGVSGRTAGLPSQG
jgi:hypothetical protein